MDTGYAVSAVEAKFPPLAGSSTEMMCSSSSGRSSFSAAHWRVLLLTAESSTATTSLRTIAIWVSNVYVEGMSVS